MCDKCGGKGYYTEEITDFSRETLSKLFNNVIEFATKAKEEFDAKESDTDALLVLGTYLMVTSDTMNTNLDTVMRLTIEKMDDDPELFSMVMDRAVNAALKRQGSQN